jgi:large repetitive protein
VPAPAPQPAAPAVIPPPAPVAPPVVAAPPPAAVTNKPVSASVTNTPADPGYYYTHEEVARVPWSIHTVKVARNRKDLVLDTVLGGGATIGMGVVSEMVTTLPAEAGKPVAAVNGDFFNYSRNYPGDPQGLQITRGELVSAPYSERVCFWVDPKNDLHRTNVTPNFQVTWPDGTKTPFGLNQDREIDEVVLFTSAIGASTRTYGGREMILTSATNTSLTPLQVGRLCVARVQSVSEAGNSPLTRDTLVLSVGPRLVARLPKLTAGAVVQVATATIPDMSGATTGLGGGPTLLRAGKPAQWRGWLQLRHPRTAIGWNKDFIYLVEVDGRQSNSIGMTFPELADYMLKLGCQEALNLDGGGSATLWMDGQVKNSPSPGQERPAANAVVLLQKPGK